MRLYEMFLLGFVSALLLCAIIILVSPDIFTTKKPQTPQINITIKNGVADTTYTYKFN